MKPFKHWIEYAFIKALEGVITAPPLATAVRWGESLGLALRAVLRGRSRMVTRNLTASFPEKTPAEIHAIADRFWRNLGRTAVEFVRAREVVPDVLGNSHDVDNLDVLRAAFAEKKGVIVVAAHYCNWEINGILLQRVVADLGEKFTAIARPMKNPRAQAWVQSRRSSGGIPVILHRQAVKASLRALRAGEAIGILIDQNLYTGGVFVDFFGRPAATTPLPALLHSRTEAPVVLTHVRRSGDRFRMTFERIRLPAVAEADRFVAWSRVINERFEAVIRATPEWWFWIHNRWKRTAEAAAVS